MRTNSRSQGRVAAGTQIVDTSSWGVVVAAWRTYWPDVHLWLIPGCLLVVAVAIGVALSVLGLPVAVALVPTALALTSMGRLAASALREDRLGSLGRCIDLATAVSITTVIATGEMLVTRQSQFAIWAGSIVLGTLLLLMPFVLGRVGAQPEPLAARWIAALALAATHTTLSLTLVGLLVLAGFATIASMGGLLVLAGPFWAVVASTAADRARIELSRRNA